MPRKSKTAAQETAGINKQPCETCPLRKLAAFREFEKEELAFMASFKVGELIVKSGSTIFMEGHDSPHLFTILDGWAMRFKSLASGKRQVLNFGLRGDLIGLQSVLFDKMLHSVQALSDVRLCVFSRQRMWQLYERHAGLGYDVTWMAAREESILAEHLASVGQKPARERVAYALIYLFDRARRAGLTEKNSLTMPVTQEHLADAMGLSLVHANKTFQKLRKTGLLDWHRGRLTIADEEKLAELAGYDLEPRRPRPFL